MIRWYSFARDQRGGVLLLFGFASLVLTLCIGLAIDSARIYSVDRRVQNALDASALSGAKSLNDSPDATQALQASAYASFTANIAGIGPTEASISGFLASPDGINSTVTTAVNVNIPTLFGRLAGVPNVAVRKLSTASYVDPHLEIVLALDITGSMATIPAGDIQSKLASLKVAASDLVNTLFNEATSDTNIRISVVPWASGVNPGNTYYSAVTGSAGSGCVVERNGSGATSDSLPSPLTYAEPLTAANIALGYVCPTQTVIPLQGRLNRTSIANSISNLNAGGGTAGHIGTAWAWNMISPAWTDLHPIGSKPEPSQRNVLKAAVIMTDGIFNTSFVGGVLSTGVGGYDETSYNLFRTICDGMKADGIQIYTVAFDLTDVYALGKLNNCASSGVALTAANASQLFTAFKAIVADLHSIKITR